MSKSLKARCIRRWEVEFKDICDSKVSPYWRKQDLRGYIREAALKSAVIERKNLSEEIRKSGRPPHTDFWHQSISMADKKVNDALNCTPTTDAAIASLRAEGEAPLVKALRTIANSEEIDGDTVVCDFNTLVSVAAGALSQYYAAQLRSQSEQVKSEEDK